MDMVRLPEKCGISHNLDVKVNLSLKLKISSQHFHLYHTPKPLPFLLKTLVLKVPPKYVAIKN